MGGQHPVTGTWYLWRTDDEYFGEWFLSVYQVGPGNETQIVILGVRCFTFWAISLVTHISPYPVI